MNVDPCWEGWLQRGISSVQEKEELEAISYLVSGELLGVQSVRGWRMKSMHTPEF